MPDPFVSRREFGLSLAALSALATAASAQGKTLPGEAVADHSKPANKTPPADAEAGDKTNAPSELTPGSQEVPEAVWMLSLILKRYPDERLDEAALRGILSDIQSDLRRSKTLAEFPLDNADEPGLVFRAFDGE
ncbi:hypothetical protein GC176_24040 [bacterium]|nr:hypothetical protein [bacterium]